LFSPPPSSSSWCRCGCGTTNILFNPASSTDWLD
jgi:hypothetical protein